MTDDGELTCPRSEAAPRVDRAALSFWPPRSRIPVPWHLDRHDPNAAPLRHRIRWARDLRRRAATARSTGALRHGAHRAPLRAQGLAHPLSRTLQLSEPRPPGGQRTLD